MKNEDKSKSLLVIVLGLLVLYFIFKSIYFIWIALGIGIISLMIPIIGDYILKGWFKIGELLGFINSRILLGGIFFIFLTPFAWLQKIFSKDSTSIQLNDVDKSVYRTREHQYEPKDFENIW
jgi:hypothetical protein